MNLPPALVCLELLILVAEVLITGAVYSAPPLLEVMACVGCCSRVGIKNPDGDARRSIMTLHSVSNDPEANEGDDNGKLSLFVCQVFRTLKWSPTALRLLECWEHGEASNLYYPWDNNATTPQHDKQKGRGRSTPRC